MSDSSHPAPAGDRLDALRELVQLLSYNVALPKHFAADPTAYEDIEVAAGTTMVQFRAWQILCAFAALSSGETPAEPMPKPHDACATCYHLHYKHLGGPCTVDSCNCRQFAAPPATEPGDAPSEDIEGLLWSFARYCVQTAISSERLAEAPSYEAQSAMLDELARRLVEQGAADRLLKAFSDRASRAGGTV